MKRTKYLSAFIAVCTAVSCTTQGGKANKEISAPRAIPVYDSGPTEGIINGLKNIQQLSREGGRTIYDIRDLGRALKN